MAQDIKPGWKTSEFALTAVTSALSLLVMAGTIGPADSSRLVELAKEILSGIIALSGIVSYISGRIKLKSQ